MCEVHTHYLENVQGDERDVIFISVTYGPSEPGAKVMQRFGPINSAVGHRRLRALSTRFLPSILGLDCACQPLLFGDHEDSSTLTMACNYEVHLMAFNLACP